MDNVQILVLLIQVAAGLWIYYSYRKQKKLEWETIELKRENERLKEDNEKLKNENLPLSMFQSLIRSGFRIAQAQYPFLLIGEAKRGETSIIKLWDVLQENYSVSEMCLRFTENRIILEYFTAVRKEFAVIMLSELLFIKEEKGIIEVGKDAHSSYMSVFLNVGGNKLLAGDEGVSKYKVLEEFKKRA